MIFFSSKSSLFLYKSWFSTTLFDICRNIHFTKIRRKFQGLPLRIYFSMGPILNRKFKVPISNWPIISASAMSRKWTRYVQEKWRNQFKGPVHEKFNFHSRFRWGWRYLIYRSHKRFSPILGVFSISKKNWNWNREDTLYRAKFYMRPYIY